MNKKTLLALAIIAVMSAGAYTSNQVFAESSTAQGNMTSLVQKIAEKFNLNQNDVQAVFDEVHQEREIQMQKDFESNLTQLVTDGKITEEQKQLILTKHQELETQHKSDRESMQSLTPEQRRTKMQEERTSLESWASENGIDIQYLMPRGRHGDGFGPKGGPDGIAPGESTQNTTQ